MAHRATMLAASVLLAIVALAACVAGAGASPPGRGYELVSPPSKAGADIVAHSYKTVSTPDGNGVAFVGLGAFGDVKGTSTECVLHPLVPGAPSRRATYCTSVEVPFTSPNAANPTNATPLPSGVDTVL